MRSTWKDHARCNEIGPAMFCPNDGTPGALWATYRDAKRICAGCPVSNLCLAEAMREEDGLNELFRAGVWGGKTPGERVALDLAAHRDGCQFPQVAA